MPYTLESSAKGAPVLVYTDEKTGKKISIHSAYNPVKEAERLAGSFHPGRSSLIIVTGIGLGFHIAELKKKFPGYRIIVLERDEYAADLCRRINPESLKGIELIFQKEKLLSLFEEEDISSFRGFRTLYFRTVYSIEPDFYNDIISDIRKLISSKVSDLLTRFEFEELWAENILKNTVKIISNHRIIEFFGKYSGYPGVIISAGPSLRKNISSLKLIQDRAVLICVDTALPVVEKAGIKPHFVIALDAQKHTLNHFLPHMNSDIPLIADAVSYPRVSDEYKGKLIFSSTAKYYDSSDGKYRRETTPFLDWLEKHIPPIGDIQSGGSVATSAFDLILNLGCSSIILIGQDLAYTGREIHSSGTHHNDNWLPGTNRFSNLETINQKIITRRKTRYVDAFGGNGTVISDFVLDMYKNWFEDSTARIKIPVYNSTGGGAHIRGCIEKSIDEIAAGLKKPDITPARITEKILSAGPDTGSDLKKAIESAEKNLNRLIELCEDSSSAMDEIMKLSGDGEISLMLKPFLKKTNTVINRGASFSGNEAVEMYRKELTRSCRKLTGLLGTIYNKI
ncbi:MAG: motility associated factor glycosyltransferase family protein [Spirochaetes bacterium]|nr:motility associated factor glycosyltransferase family protein [Spirochaetota bacterium]